MEEKFLNAEKVGIRETQKLWSLSRRPSRSHFYPRLTERNSWLQLDHDGDLEPMQRYVGPSDARIEVPRTIRRAGVNCIDQKTKEADRWIWKFGGIGEVRGKQ